MNIKVSIPTRWEIKSKIFESQLLHPFDKLRAGSNVARTKNTTLEWATLGCIVHPFAKSAKRVGQPTNPIKFKHLTIG